MGFNKHAFCNFEQNKNNLNWSEVPPGRTFCLVRDSGRFAASSASSCTATGVSCATQFLAVMLVLASPEAGCWGIREFEASLSSASESSLNKVKYWALGAFDEKGLLLVCDPISFILEEYAPNESKKKQLYYSVEELLMIKVLEQTL